jgi:WD40 repeat protein
VASDLYLIIVPIEEQQLIRIWNRDTLTIIHGYKGHEKQITSVIFLKDKNRIASTSYDGTVRIWDANENFEFDQELKMYVNKYPLLALVEIDEETVAFGGDDCFITIWNWSKEVVRYKCFAHPGSITSLSTCSPHFLYSIGGDSRIIAWRIEIINEEKVKVDFDLSLNDEIKPPETERKFHLTQVKEFTEHITQNLFTINISHHEVLAIDSRGNTYLMTHNLDIYSSKVKLDYTESIRHAKLWRNSFLVVTTKKGRGELKEVEADFEHVIRQEKGREMIPISAIKTTIIQITTKNSIEASINAQSTKIMARR